MVAERPKYFSEMEDAPEVLKSLDQTRRLSTREGWCRAHIEAIQVAIDQYAEAAFGNREFFLNKPHSIGPTQSRRHSLDDLGRSVLSHPVRAPFEKRSP